MPHRCAFGCKNTNSGVVMHMFPNPKRFPEHFHAWVNILGGKFERLSDHEIYLRKRICDIHFTDAHRNRYKRLNALAMPTLYLPETIAPSITNLIKTLEGIESLWKLLSRKYGIDAMLKKNFNQDPIENFGVRNIAPNTVSFEGAFKALMINNYSEPHSSGANCEEDHNECLQSLDFFLKDKNIITLDIPDTNDTIHFNSEICFDQSNEINAGQTNYVCRWVLKRCLKFIIKGCQHCKQTLFENDISNDNNSYIYAKEYMNKKWLCYPNKEVESYFKEIQDMTTSFFF
ncbi:unnamed protein product, partial [Brenthis ino]